MKFNKDTFSSNISSHVQNAIDNNIITKEDYDSNNIKKLHGFIKYELLEYCKDRSFAIDVLRAIEFDQSRKWEELQNEFGTFKSLLDIALVDLFLYLKSLNLTEFSAYKFNNQKDSPLLDLVHDKTDINANVEAGNRISLPSEDNGGNVPVANDNYGDEDNFNDNLPDFNDEGDFNEPEPEPAPEERPRRKIRLARQ